MLAEACEEEQSFTEPETISSDIEYDHAVNQMKTDEPTIESNSIKMEAFDKSDLDKEHYRLLEQILVKEERMWKCKVCGKKLIKKSDLKKHAVSHIGGVPQECHICNKVTPNRRALREHIGYNHADKLLNCEYCGKMGMTRKKYQKHLRAHRKNKFSLKNEKNNQDEASPGHDEDLQDNGDLVNGQCERIVMKSHKLMYHGD